MRAARPGRRAVVVDQGKRLGAAATVRALEVLGETLVDFRHAPDPRLLLDVALVRLTNAQADTSIEALAFARRAPRARAGDVDRCGRETASAGARSGRRSGRRGANPAFPEGPVGLPGAVSTHDRQGVHADPAGRPVGRGHAGRSWRA